MTRKIYIRPIAFAQSPQSEDGHAVRLGGSMVWASRFALIVRDNGRIVSRERISAEDMPAALAAVPEDLAERAQQQWENLRKVHAPMRCGERLVRLDQPQIMGILNMTPDSFSDGGSYWVQDGDATSQAAAHAAAMLEAGAAIVDVGGESTRPGAKDVWEGDEIARVIPIIQKLSAMGAAISMDTRRAGVMDAGLAAGGHIINDVSALRYDPRSVELAASSQAPVVLMHAPSADGHDLHGALDYEDVAIGVYDWLEACRDKAVAAGVQPENIILDPGFGFGLTLTQNLGLFNALPMFHALGHPLLVGVSRKRMIGALSQEAPADQRLGGSLALAVKAMDAGVQILRVHDVPETVQAARVWRGLRDAALTDFAQMPL